MKYQIKILLISICILGIGLPQDKYKNVEGGKKVHVDSDTQHWDKEDNNVKDPELKKLLEELKIEFKSERDDLKDQFKKKVEALKKEYTNKRKNLRKKYIKKNKKKRPDKKPESLNDGKKPKESKEFNKEEIKKNHTKKNEDKPVINKK